MITTDVYKFKKIIDLSTVISLILPGVAKYGGTVIAVGGENEKCWIAGLFLLKNENGKDVWTKCQELSDVLSMFGCGVANLPKNLLQDLGQS